MSEHFNTLVEINLAGNEANVIMAAYGELNCALMSTNVFTGHVSVSQSHLVSILCTNVFRGCVSVSFSA